MLFFNPYIEIFLREIKTFREKHKIIDVPFIPSPLYSSPLYSQTGYPDVTLAMFAPFTDENIINQLSVEETIDGIDVTVVVIGQG